MSRLWRFFDANLSRGEIASPRLWFLDVGSVSGDGEATEVVCLLLDSFVKVPGCLPVSKQAIAAFSRYGVINVLVVDDHDLVRTGIRRMLADVDGVNVVGEADSGEAAVLRARELKPDVVLMDVKMPGIGGLEATRKIIRSHPEIRVIAVTVCDEEPFPTRLMQAGAAGYLTKGAALEEMIKAIRQVFAGQRYISVDIAQQLALKPFQPQGEASPFDLLSEREMQIALMIADCQKVQSISDKLCLSPKTVNTYRYRIFEKLKIETDVQLVRLAMRHGMVEVDG